MAKRKHFTVYWDEQEEGELMEKLEEVARREKRSKSSTVLIALREEERKRNWKEYNEQLVQRREILLDRELAGLIREVLGDEPGEERATLPLSPQPDVVLGDTEG